MSTLAVPAQPARTHAAVITPDDLLQMPDAIQFELVDGQLVERNMGCESSEVGMRIALRLGPFIEERDLGHLLGSDAGYQCFPATPGKVRKPDVSFVRNGRLPGERIPKGFAMIPPDLAIEVISPNDTADEVEEKVLEYLGAGVRLIWIVYPVTRTIHVRRPRSSPLGSTAELCESDTLSGEDVLPGFASPVAACFGRVAPAQR